MNFPIVAKRAFPGLVLALLTTSGYLVASGISALIETALLPDVTDLTRTDQPASTEKPRHRRSFDTAALLERNPFDSVTGSLLAKPGETASGPPPPPVDPLNAPSCTDVDVYSTIVSSDPLWSSAVIQGPGEARGHVRRVGGTVGSRRIALVGRNPVARSPAVWLEENTTLCQALLFNGRPRGPAAPRPAPAVPAPAAPPAAPAPPAKPRAQTPLPADISARIRRVSATEFHIDRSAIDRIMGDYAALVRGSRMRPVRNNGRVSGFRLDRISPQSLVRTPRPLGWRRGRVDQRLSADSSRQGAPRLRVAAHRQRAPGTAHPRREAQ